MRERVLPQANFLIFFQLLCVVTNSHAQVRELWQTALTNSGFIGYTLRQATVDSFGNTFVGGSITTLDNMFNPSGLVAKFDPKGNKAWEKQIGTNAFSGIDGLDVDYQGNVFVAVRVNSHGEDRSLALVKLAPDGGELWRVNEPFVTDADVGSFLKVDAAGNVILTTILVRGLNSTEQIAEQIVSKF